MKIRIEFGFPVVKKLQINYFGSSDIQNYHPIVKYDDKFWEFILFDKDPNGVVDFILTFGEIPRIDETTTFYDLDFHHGSQITPYGSRCECGANYQRGFENIHSFWCPKWEKI